MENRIMGEDFMKFFRFLRSVLCALFIVAMCLLAASVFNSKLADTMEKVGKEALSAIKEFSEKAEVNVFSEADRLPHSAMPGRVRVNSEKQ